MYIREVQEKKVLYVVNLNPSFHIFTRPSTRGLMCVHNKGALDTLRNCHIHLNFFFLLFFNNSCSIGQCTPRKHKPHNDKGLYNFFFQFEFKRLIIIIFFLSLAKCIELSGACAYIMCVYISSLDLSHFLLHLHPNNEWVSSTKSEFVKQRTTTKQQNEIYFWKQKIFLLILLLTFKDKNIDPNLQ